MCHISRGLCRSEKMQNECCSPPSPKQVRDLGMWIFGTHQIPWPRSPGNGIARSAWSRHPSGTDSRPDQRLETPFRFCFKAKCPKTNFDWLCVLLFIFSQTRLLRDAVHPDRPTNVQTIRSLGYLPILVPCQPGLRGGRRRRPTPGRQGCDGEGSPCATLHRIWRRARMSGSCAQSCKSIVCVALVSGLPCILDETCCALIYLGWMMERSLDSISAPGRSCARC